GDPRMHRRRRPHPHRGRRRAQAPPGDLPLSPRPGSARERRDGDGPDAGIRLHRAGAMSHAAAPVSRPGWIVEPSLRGELVKVSAFFLRSWRMTYRNAFTVFEIVFWPIVNLLSVGLLTTFLQAEPGTGVFVLVRTFALSTVQVCQLDVAYAALFDMWSRSIKHQLVAPIPPWHLLLGAWLMGLLRGTLVFMLQAAVSHWMFGVNVLAHGVAPAL